MSDIVERLLETKSEYGVQTRLVDRLRGKYASGPHLPNGKPEFGWRQFEAPPIQHEAATAIEELAAEITRLRSLLKDSEWRDISTAPRDGTRILAVDRNGWREMWWVTNGTDYADYWQDDYDSEPEPTHWLPLPPPPEKEET